MTIEFAYVLGWLCAVAVIGIGLLEFGYRIGTTHTEERWKQAVGRTCSCKERNP